MRQTLDQIQVLEQLRNVRPNQEMRITGGAVGSKLILQDIANPLELEKGISELTGD